MWRQKQKKKKRIESPPPKEKPPPPWVYSRVNGGGCQPISTLMTIIIDGATTTLQGSITEEQKKNCALVENILPKLRRESVAFTNAGSWKRGNVFDACQTRCRRGYRYIGSLSTNELRVTIANHLYSSVFREQCGSASFCCHLSGHIFGGRATSARFIIYFIFDDIIPCY